MRKPGAPQIVLALLCLFYLILFVNRVNISTAGPLMKADLKLSNTQLGLVFSAFAIPYALFQLIGGWIGDKLGPRLTLSVCSVMVAMSTILTGAARGFVSLFLLRLCFSAGRLSRARAPQYGRDRASQYLQIEPERPFIDVLHIEFHPSLEGN